MEPCKETGKLSEKGNTDSPLAKSEDKENKPGMPGMNLYFIKPLQIVLYMCCLGIHIFYVVVFVVADDLKSDDVLEGRLNGDKDTLDELEESRKEDKNGFKAKFMFNIADGGFTGKIKHNFVLIPNGVALIKEVIE